MSKYGVISGPYFPVFSPNTGKDGPEITPYLDTFHAVYNSKSIIFIKFFVEYNFVAMLSLYPNFQIAFVFLQTLPDVS